MHGPKEKDIDILNKIASTGLPHQIVLSKLDRAAPTLWKELGAALKENPTKESSTKIPRRIAVASWSTMDQLQMGVWAALRGNLSLGCDDTILGISSREGWGISNLRCSILMACGLFREESFGNDKYLESLQQIPIIPDASGSLTSNSDSKSLEGESEQEHSHEVSKSFEFKDDNPMRGEVFGGEGARRKRIYRW